MKKFFMIVVLFCAATLISNAEAIEDKDFEKFFNQFQKELKESKGVAYVISNHIDYSTLQAKLKLDGEELLSALLSFVSEIQTDYKDVCNLSAKNKYSIKKKTKTGKDSHKRKWGYIQSGESNTDPSGLFVSLNAKKQYHLSTGGSYYEDGEGGESGGNWCIFEKINGEWKIVDFDAAG